MAERSTENIIIPKLFPYNRVSQHQLSFHCQHNQLDLLSTVTVSLSKYRVHFHVSCCYSQL